MSYSLIYTLLSSVFFLVYDKFGGERLHRVMISLTDAVGQSSKSHCARVGGGVKWQSAEGSW